MLQLSHLYDSTSVIIFSFLEALRVNSLTAGVVSSLLLLEFHRKQIALIALAKRKLSRMVYKKNVLNGDFDYSGRKTPVVRQRTFLLVLHVTHA